MLSKNSLKYYIHKKIKITVCNFQTSRKWRDNKNVINYAKIIKDENKQARKYGKKAWNKTITREGKISSCICRYEVEWIKNKIYVRFM